ncbi:MAG: DEAD/DEAH box helicase, partial [Myxococcales bacterium]|nr:DEAD/DEAH box helicase [Myxococcales bacterium]
MSTIADSLPVPTTFAALGLEDALLKAVADEGYETPTPIQLKAIPEVLAGRDLLGIAQTGTGKTAAFALPMLQLLAARPRPRQLPRALVLAPTRELASQIGESFRVYGRALAKPPSCTVIFGGVGQDPQVRALRAGVDVLVATPGRLIDLLGQKLASLAGVEILVLDEADRMLDMGFIHDVRRIVGQVPTTRHTLFFSATMPGEVLSLARGMLKDPVRVEVAPPATTVERVDQSVYFVEKAEKRRLLATLLADPGMAKVLVFTRTKHGANKVVKDLTQNGTDAQPIHGNKSQTARERALAGFRAGSVRVLVATDIAARGIDVDGITHVVNYDLPNIPESYVHRIGRTARAGADGMAISFCDGEERAFLRDIERTIRQSVPRGTLPTLMVLPPAPVVARERPERSGGAGRGAGRGAG